MSTSSIQRIADLEEANYAATLITAQVTPGLTVSLRDDVIMTTSETLPSPDTNHACRLKSTPQHIDSLLDEITEHFRARDRPTTIFVSPACTPANLGDLLRARGFLQQREHPWNPSSQGSSENMTSSTHTSLICLEERYVP